MKSKNIFLLATLILPKSFARRRKRHISRSQWRPGSGISRLSPSGQLPPSRTLKDNSDKSEESKELLRERWVELLSAQLQNEPASAIRTASHDEDKFYYSAEILADRLLGIEDLETGTNLSTFATKQTNEKKSHLSSISDEISLLWKSVAYGSSSLLVAFPITLAISTLISSPTVASFFSTTISPAFSASVISLQSTFQNTLLQTRTLFKSLHHIHKIKLFPLLVKIIRKCIILEVWRHVWVRVYKLSRYIWRGTLKNVAKLYFRFVPSFIRRGVKNMFQSMVQAHVHGVVGSAVGSVLSGVTFESWVWTSSPSSTTDVASDDVSFYDSSGTTLDADGLVDIGADSVSESVSESAAQGFQSTMQSVIDDSTTAAVESALGSSVESMVDDVLQNSISDSLSNSVSDGVESSLENVVDSIVDSSSVEEIISGAVESMDDAAESILDTSLESSLDEAMDSIVEDALTSAVSESVQDCVDSVVETALDH